MPEIIVTESGFTIVEAKTIDAVAFEEVEQVIAYKIDEIATDLVCCDIVATASNGKATRTIHEEIAGFDALMSRFETLPGFNAKWREAVILPPFAESKMTVYNRTGEAV